MRFGSDPAVRAGERRRRGNSCLLDTRGITSPTFLQAITYIRSFVTGFQYVDYVQDRKTVAAVERELLIIAEAAYRLGEEASALCPGLPWQQIRQLGNVVRHGYHAIDSERIWNTVQQELDPMYDQVNEALAKLA